EQDVYVRVLFEHGGGVLPGLSGLGQGVDDGGYFGAAALLQDGERAVLPLLAVGAAYVVIDDAYGKGALHALKSGARGHLTCGVVVRAYVGADHVRGDGAVYGDYLHPGARGLVYGGGVVLVVYGGEDYGLGPGGNGVRD